jgi:RNA polymerase sigma-70 factor (ECF subfamily)
MMDPHEGTAGVEQIEYIARDTTKGFDLDDGFALAARTDAAAFELIYTRNRSAVYRYLRTRTISGDDAADLTALTFERAFVAIGRYRPGGAGVRAWLVGIARNASIDHGRRRLAAPPPDRPPDPDEGPETRLVANETAAELRQHVAALPPDQRDAIVLRFAAGLTAAEIGAVLGKTEAASQKLVSRGLAVLKEAYCVRSTGR